MEKKYIILLWSLFFTIYSEGQATYNKLIYDESIGDWGRSIIVEDTDIVIVGFTYVPIDGSNWVGVFFRRIDFEGNVLLEKFFAKPNSSFYLGNVGGILEKASDNNYLSGGAYQYIDSAFFGDLGSKAILCKFNSVGDTIWTKTFTGGGGFAVAYGSSLASNDESIIVGERSDTVVSSIDFYFIKTDSSGNIIWEKTDDYNLINQAFTVDSYKNGDIIIGGRIYSDYSLNDGKGLIIKLDSLGSIIWEKEIGTISGNDTGLLLKLSHDGKNILMFQGLDTIISSGDYERPYCVGKLNNDGNYVWRSFFNGPAQLDIWSIEEVQDNGIIACGIRKDPPSYVPLGYICKLDSNGNKLWGHVYYTRTDIDNYLTDIAQMSDGGYILTGSAFSETNQDVWLLRLDCMGCLTPGCDGTGVYTCDSILPIDTISDTTIIISEILFQPAFKIYPNPIKDVAIAEIKIPSNFPITKKANLELSIYDMQGELIDSYSNIGVMNANETIRFNINRKNIASGIYFAKLKYTSTILKIIKVVFD